MFRPKPINSVGLNINDGQDCFGAGGPYSMRGQDRYGCSNHIMTGACSNGRGIRRTVIEERVLTGLKDRLMAPEAAAEAMRAYAEETNRINRERRASGAGEGTGQRREEDRRHDHRYRGRWLFARCPSRTHRLVGKEERTAIEGRELAVYDLYEAASPQPGSIRPNPDDRHESRPYWELA